MGFWLLLLLLGIEPKTLSLLRMYSNTELGTALILYDFSIFSMQVKYREEYEKNKGKSMLEFVETPSYQSSKEAQKMQSEVGVGLAADFSLGTFLIRKESLSDDWF